jgi:hypothetical protein
MAIYRRWNPSIYRLLSVIKRSGAERVNYTPRRFSMCFGNLRPYLLPAFFK